MEDVFSVENMVTIKRNASNIKEINFLNKIIKINPLKLKEKLIQNMLKKMMINIYIHLVNLIVMKIIIRKIFLDYNSDNAIEINCLEVANNINYNNNNKNNNKNNFITWILDSGESISTTNDKNHLINIRNVRRNFC